MKQKEKILFITSEAVPFIKTGGLADVAGSLPAAIDSRFFDVRVILPKYACMKDTSGLRFMASFTIGFMGKEEYAGLYCANVSGVTYYFIDSEYYFSGEKPYGDWKWDITKFCFFEQAALAALKAADFRPDVIHCHDWQTGLVPVYLRQFAEGDAFYRGIRTVFTIHNLKFQGSWSMDEMKAISGLPDRYFTVDGLEYYGGANMLKGGVVYSDAVTTVSPTYAEEIKTPEYGEGLDGLMRARSDSLRGILNGVDYREFDPATDDLILKKYDVSSFRQRKKRNKTDILSKMGMETEEDRMLAVMVSRLTDQKGLDILMEACDDLMKDGIALIVVGTGDPKYEDYFRGLSERYPGKAAFYAAYSDTVAHQAYAGADVLLMPSRFEPCGLSQLIALRYGTLPVVRETGGLADTVEPYNRFTDQGTGFSFAGYRSDELADTVRRAEELYFSHRIKWNRMVERAMRKDFSWKNSALKYQEMYNWLTGRF